MSDDFPPDVDDVAKPLPEGEPVELPPEEPKKKRGPKKAAEAAPEDAAFLAGFAESAFFDAGVRIRDVEAYQKAPIPAELVIPDGYRLSVDGQLWRRAGKDGKETRHIATRIPLLGRVLLDPESREERLEIVFKRHNRWRRSIVDRAVVSVGGRDTARALGAVGAPVEPVNARDVAQWLARLESENEQHLPCALVTSRSGWHELEDGGRVFVLGGHALERGVDGAATSSRVVFDDRDAAGVVRHVRVAGDEGVQRALVTRAIASCPAAAAAIIAALAAPLLERVGAPGFAFHLVGPSSRGKTTALTVAASIYGCPEIRGGQGWVSSWDSTSAGLEHRAALSSDLPLCLDEAGLVQAEQRERDVYMLVAGQGKTRGAAAGGIRKMTAWRTVVVSTGEEELVRIDKAHAGAQVRCIQARVDGLGDMTGPEVAELGAAARTHFGHLGRLWISKLLEVQDWEPHRLRYAAIGRELREVLAARSSIEQRQAEAFAVLELAVELAASWLGLPYTAAPRILATSTEYRVELVPEWRRALEAIVEWVGAEPGAFPELHTDSDMAKRTRPPVDSQHRPASRYAGYYDRSPEISYRKVVHAIYLLPGVARAYLEERGLGLDTVAREWKREGVLLPEGEQLKRRVRVDGVRQRFYVIDLEAAGLGPEGGIGRPGTDPGTGPNPSARDQQTTFGGGIGGIGGIGPGEATPARMRAGAHARSEASNDELTDPTDPNLNQDLESTDEKPGIGPENRPIPTRSHPPSDRSHPPSRRGDDRATFRDEGVDYDDW